ncbi:hypothetical protein Tco_0264816 [Tanacetum coccineum]
MLLPWMLTSSYPWGVQSQGDRPSFPPWSGHRGLRHLPNAYFLSQYNINLARQVAMGSQLRLRVLKRKVHGLRNQTKNLEMLLEAEADMKKAAEAKNTELTKELESLRVWFLDLQVNNNQLSQQVSNLQAQITGEEKIKATFEQFKKYEDDRVEQRCAEMDAPLWIN